MITDNPLISVVLPYYNAQKTLKRAIESILNQTFEDFELILVNNNSQDKSLEIAENFATQDNRVKLVNESAQGVVHAANTGNSCANGKFIARMDADDISSPKRLEIQIASFHTNPLLDISATQVKYLSETASDTSFHHFVNWSNSIVTQQQIIKNKFVEFPLVNPSLMVRAEVIQKIGPFQEGDFPEDYQWFLNAADKNCIIEKIPQILLQWNDNPDRLTRVDTKYSSQAFFSLKTEYLAKEIKKIRPHDNNVWIWGAGKLGYARSQWLLNHQINISGYIDIKEKTLQKHQCIHFSKIDLRKHPFIISYITNRNKRDEVRDFLNSRGYEESKDYIIAG